MPFTVIYGLISIILIVVAAFIGYRRGGVVTGALVGLGTLVVLFVLLVVLIMLVLQQM